MEGITMQRDWFHVYTAATMEEADIIVAWLADRGVDASVRDRNVASTLTFGVAGTSTSGAEVIVQDEETAARATALLKEHTPTAAEDDAGDHPEFVEAVCDECGARSSFPYDARGKVEDCPECGCYLDVPGDDE
jgi:hypothetical protein